MLTRRAALLSAAAAALLAATSGLAAAQSSVTLYGRVGGGILFGCRHRPDRDVVPAVAGTMGVELRRCNADFLVDRVARGLGLGENDYRWLEPAELAEQLRVTNPYGALYSPHCATIQPARLVRGLARWRRRSQAETSPPAPITSTPDAVLLMGMW